MTTHQYMGIRNFRGKKFKKSGSKEFFNESTLIFLNGTSYITFLTRHFQKFLTIINLQKKKNFRNRLWIRLMSMLWAQNNAKITAIDLNLQSVKLTRKRLKILN